MPEYEIEVYELHADLVRVTADSPEQALLAFQNGEAEGTHGDYREYLCLAFEYGKTIYDLLAPFCKDTAELAQRCDAVKEADELTLDDDVVQAVRSITEVTKEGEEA